MKGKPSPEGSIRGERGELRHRRYMPFTDKQWHIVSLQKYTEALWVCETTLDPKEMGKYLHAIQDYFAHSATALAGRKHSSEMDDPFSGYHEWNKTMEMIQLTFNLIRDFKERVAEAAFTLVSAALISFHPI